MGWPCCARVPPHSIPCHTDAQFLNALERAGFPLEGDGRHEIDRVPIPGEVSVVECARLMSFFDRDGDGTLRYNEFMRLLQDTKLQAISALSLPSQSSSADLNLVRPITELGVH